MRICIYTETALPKLGGQELVVDALARQFVKMGHETSVLAPYPRHGLALRDQTYPYRMARHPRFYSTRWGVPWYRYFLSSHFQKYPFDILHCHGLYPAGYLAALLKEKLPVPMVLTSHGGDVRQGNVRLRRAVIKARHELAVRTADRLIAISGFTRQGFLRLGAAAERIVDIPNGVDLDSLDSPAEAPGKLAIAAEPGKYFLFLGRLVRRKGVDLILQALRQSPDISIPLLICGDGDERNALQQSIAQDDLRGRVQFLGRVDGQTKRWLLRNALCTILPSRDWEAFPLVVLESYAAGRPMIATRIPGLMDLVREGKTGLLAEENNPAELARVMRGMMENKNASDEMGRQARRWAEEFSWDAIARRHIDLYKEMLK